GVELVARIVRDAGEMDDGVVARDLALKHSAVPDVPFHLHEARVLRDRREHVFTVLVKIHYLDAMTAFEQSRDQNGPYVSGSAGDKNLFQSFAPIAGASNSTIRAHPPAARPGPEAVRSGSA